MGKLTVRCPRCYESFSFDLETARQNGSGYFEKDSEKYDPYRKSPFWENLKQNVLNLKSRFQNPHPRLFDQTPGKRLAKNFLLILLAIGIVRTCFFSPFQNLQNSNPFPNTTTTPPETRPQEIIPEESPQEQPEPKFEI
ncbi:hypothetical protein LEP1GSC036_1230 [Leptospira weilii str. 2006001853]|uniref:Uncharacterized protein n=1 Tax=Leptospira weilii str. 2006001853 TaxID=1001589 RepID=A0A828YYQ8_9LEPT|nr:hypothetical protein [Leptospira weilii]EKR64006.1 hypothetical protein LEP1GSC036_1230 [Leptospira weilii str. 2006001853]EMN43074.1 hypothetical protein LEP1GSC086_0318 [Leptospira weilii str. LNT 1234]QDK23568.1 hypothetical protein FHG67_13170 [Leptospira weilii]QDK26792.1 hypothetical protein FHG68_09080 [Leptospira weilii]